MEANGRLKHDGYSAAHALGQREWSNLNKSQRNFFEGLFSAAKGRISERAVRRRFDDVDAPSFENAEAIRRENNMPTPKEDDPTYVFLLPEHGGKYRKFDDALQNTSLKRIFRYFLVPRSAPGEHRKIEIKAIGAIKDSEQIEKDAIIKKYKNIYGNNTITLLQTSYNDLPKDELRNLIKNWLTDPELSAQQYITKGRELSG